MRLELRRTTNLASHMTLLTLAAITFVGVVGAAEPMPATSATAAIAPTKILLGSQEVPPVTTTATAISSITIAADRTVTGTVTTTGIDGTAAHVHLGARGTNGPPLITLKQVSATQWNVPTGSTLTQAQYDSYQQGEIYVNVHSALHPTGETRLQLRP